MKNQGREPCNREESAYQLLKIMQINEMASNPIGAETSNLPLHLADHLMDHLDQLVWTERLDQPAGGTRGAAGLLHLVARLDGEDQDRRRLEPWVLAQLPGQTDAVHPGHVLVGQHEADGMKSTILRLLPGILAIHGFDDMEVSVLERERHHLAHRGGIVNGKDRVHCFSG